MPYGLSSIDQGNTTSLDRGAYLWVSEALLSTGFLQEVLCSDVVFSATWGMAQSYVFLWNNSGSRP